MLRADFRKKCIIMHFLEAEKDRKSAQLRVRKGVEKRFEEVEMGDPSRDESGRDRRATGTG
jgi:hypothetical protein